MPLMEIFQWIEGLPLVRLIVTTPWVYPTISALHIIGIGVLLGSILPVDLRLLRVLGPGSDVVMPALVRMAITGFAVAATTGLLLASVRIGNYAGNPAFLAKMVILAAAGVNAVFVRALARPGDVVSLGGRTAGRFAAIFSLCCWTGAVFAGRWIGFV